MSDRTATTPAKPPPARPHEELYDELGPIPSFPNRQFDEHGHLIPISEEETRARSAATRRALRAIAAIPDAPGDEERWREAMKDLDAHRPHRPLFEGMY